VLIPKIQFFCEAAEIVEFFVCHHSLSLHFLFSLDEVVRALKMISARKIEDCFLVYLLVSKTLHFCSKNLIFISKTAA